jgi:hypothetical protein
VILPNSVKTIEEGAFWGDRDLKTLVIGEGVESIGNFVFHGTGLRRLDLTGYNTEEEKVPFLNGIFESERSGISPSNEGCVVTFSENDKWVLRDAANKTWEQLPPPPEETA